MHYSILGEISDIDQEIVALQSTLLNVYGNNQSNSNIDNSLKQKNLQKLANETNMQAMQMVSNNMSYMNDVSQNIISDTNLLDESNQQHQFLLQSQLSQNNIQEHQNLNSFQNFQNQHLTHANQLSSTKQLTGLSLGGLMTSSAQQRYNAEDICQQTTTVNGLLFNDLNMNSTVQQQNIHAIQRTIDFEGNQTQDSIKSNSRYGMMSANAYKQGNNNATQNLQNSYLVGQNVNDFSLIDEYIYENQDQRNDGCSIIQFQNEEEDNSQLQQ